MSPEIDEIAERLLLYTGYPLTAIVSLDDGGRMIEVHLFDTYWRADSLRIAPMAYEIWLISHHPEGGKTPYDEDLHNLARVKEMAAGAHVRFFLTSEYGGSVELPV